MSIGKKLKEARTKQNLTQEEVAQKLFVTRQTISRWEQDKSVPNIHVLKELSELYTISLDALFMEQSESKELELKEEKEKKQEEKLVKKINPFALIGMIFFNICLSLATFITALAVLFSLWTVTLTFIVSPLMAITVPFIISGEKFQWLQFFISLLLCAIGIILLPLAKKASMYLFNFFINYVKFNMKAIYY